MTDQDVQVDPDGHTPVDQALADLAAALDKIIQTVRHALEQP